MNYNDFLEQQKNKNMPKTMKGFFESIDIKIDTAEGESTFNDIINFIERMRKLSSDSRRKLLYLVEKSKVDTSRINKYDKSLEIKIGTLNYNEYGFKNILENLIEEKMCCFSDDDTIVLQGIIEYENFFYDLRNYCNDKKIDIKEMLVGLKFNLLD